MYEYPSVNDLIDDVKGTTSFLSSLISKKSGLVFVFILLGVIISKFLVG